jgi:hypothetical protein
LIDGARDTEWSLSILEGWTRSAIGMPRPEWLSGLVGWWRDFKIDSKDLYATARAGLLRAGLLPELLAAEPTRTTELVELLLRGGWHVPALMNPPPLKEDNDLLNGLRTGKSFVALTPWTNERLSYRSGYGAGIYSPGWYQHLWEHGRSASIRWVIRAAQWSRLNKPAVGIRVSEKGSNSDTLHRWDIPRKVLFHRVLRVPKAERLKP